MLHCLCAARLSAPARGSSFDDPGIDALCRALASSLRRAVLERLRRSPCRPGVLAGELDVSPARLSGHLRVLSRSRLIEKDPEGFCRLIIRPDRTSSVSIPHKADRRHHAGDFAPQKQE